MSLPRSTKAGASTPARQWRWLSSLSGVDIAQRRPERQPRRHLLESRRLQLPQDLAQRRPERQPRRHRQHRLEDGARFLALAQRRPERQPRRHARFELARTEVAELAQRRPERQPRRHWDGNTSIPRAIMRSTKAGASTPATLAHRGRRCQPSSRRSTKAGASTPATRLNSAKGQYRDKPSLVHGRGSLDDDVFAAISRDFGRYPVRMVRIKRRDCLDRGPSTRGFRESLRVRR